LKLTVETYGRFLETYGRFLETDARYRRRWVERWTWVENPPANGGDGVTSILSGVDEGKGARYQVLGVRGQGSGDRCWGSGDRCWGSGSIRRGSSESCGMGILPVPAKQARRLPYRAYGKLG